MTHGFKPAVMDELIRNYPNLIRLTQRMQDENDERSYNPNHPAIFNNIKSAIHPAGELMKLAIQVALENPQYMGTLTVLSNTQWNDLNTVCKEISKVAKKVSNDILNMGNKWCLGEFIANRCQHLKLI